MSYYIVQDEIKLTDGTIIKRGKDDEFPPYGDISDTGEPCHVCPVRFACDDNNAFDCEVYGMFQGAWFNFDDGLRVAKEITRLKAIISELTSELTESDKRPLPFE